MSCLTPRQSQVLAYLRDYRKEHGFSPTQMEIGVKLGMAKVTAHQHLNELQRKGCLRRNKHKARSIELTRRGVLALAVASPCPKEAAIRDVANVLGSWIAFTARPAMADLMKLRQMLLAAIGGKP